MEAKVYTKKKPSKQLLEDIVYGYTVSKHLEELGAGRTIVVKRKTIMAAEAAEGIEETIKRGCFLGHKDAVVIIAGKEGTILQNEILNIIKEAKGKILAVSEDVVNVENIDYFKKTADVLGLIFLAFDGKKNYNTTLFRQ